jgi:hypothetical protein
MNGLGPMDRLLSTVALSSEGNGVEPAAGAEGRGADTLLSFERSGSPRDRDWFSSAYEYSSAAQAQTQARRACTLTPS